MQKKKMYYVSHPFTGDEKKNRWEARLMTAALKQAYPENVFINPLDAIRYAENVPNWSYEEILSQCIDIMYKCDGIILTGMWEKSRGCMAEKKAAEQEKMEIYVLNICNFFGMPMLIEIGDM